MLIIESIIKVMQCLDTKHKIHYFIRICITTLMHFTIDQIHDDKLKFQIVSICIKVYGIYLKICSLFGIKYDEMMVHKLLNHIQSKKIHQHENCSLYVHESIPAYDLNDARVSIIIPTRDHLDDLKRCIHSINNSTYNNYEIVIVNNDSVEDKTITFLNDIDALIIDYPSQYNYAELYNIAISQCSGEYIIMLNNDTEVIEPTWIEQLVGPMIEDPTIGVTGAKLLFADHTIQHAGVVFDPLTKFFMHIYSGQCDHIGNEYKFYQSVTGACMCVSRELYTLSGGMDPNLRIAYNDTDLCMKVGKDGYQILYTPFAKLYHYEASTRGHDDTLGKKWLQTFEQLYFLQKWENILA